VAVGRVCHLASRCLFAGLLLGYALAAVGDQTRRLIDMKRHLDAQHRGGGPAVRDLLALSWQTSGHRPPVPFTAVPVGLALVEATLLAVAAVWIFIGATAEALQSAER
jgi:hypothetical protein